MSTARHLLYWAVALLSLDSSVWWTWSTACHPVGNFPSSSLPSSVSLSLSPTPSHILERSLYYRKRGSASYIVREWLLWVVERERETPVTSSISRWNREWSCIWLPRQRVDPYAYAYASTRSEPAAAVECSNCMTSQNHKQQLLRPRSGSSNKIQKHIPEQPGWRNSKYWGNIEKRNQINTKNYWK